MDREEAQNILQLCRPDNLEDRNDPLIAEALELLSQDAELSTWFDEQQSIDAEVSAELNQIEPPADLKASILAGMRAHAAQAEQQANGSLEGDEALDQSIPFPSQSNSDSHRGWLRPWMGAAAALVIAGVILLQTGGQQSTQLANNASTNTPAVATAGVPNVIEFLAQQISEFNGSKFDKRGNQIDELQSHLASTGMPNPASIPTQLSKLEALGCVTFDFENTKLSMICFKDGQVYHLITAEKATFPKDCAPNCSKAKPVFFEAKQQAFKIWSEGDQVFILTTKGTEADIPNFI